MAQDNNSWAWVGQLLQSSPELRIGAAVALVVAGGYFGRGAVKKLFGTIESEDDKDAIDKMRIANDGLAKLADAQARYIELQQQHLDGHLDSTDFGKNTTRPIKDETFDKL